ncbi:hypothetical protein DY000_02017043 [Brassica cretica]|uniref:Uncharacterized protein n=1 Tax=Brassica cretica TaxID=69181 RepID=A0ABQ7CUA7_BRACR|nr:hypothetical protein DY000_02017043 [Brassica cretica]
MIRSFRSNNQFSDSIRSVTTHIFGIPDIQCLEYPDIYYTYIHFANTASAPSILSLHPGQLQLAFPDQPARDPTAISSHDFNSSSFQLASVRGSLGGPVSTICKQKIIIRGRVALLHPYLNLITTD